MPAVVGFDVVVVFVLKKEVGKGVELQPLRGLPSCESRTVTLAEMWSQAEAALPPVIGPRKLLDRRLDSFQSSLE
jgi:hypothetical protein